MRPLSKTPHEKAKAYKYDHPLIGTRYFKVLADINKDVLQIVTNSVLKKGRPFCIGMTYIKRNSFTGNWGWKLDESKYINEIELEHFNDIFNKMVEHLRYTQASPFGEPTEKFKK